MFETIVNFLSPGALSNSTSLQPPVAAFKMARQTRPSLESAPPMLAGPDSGHNTLPHADEAIGVDFSGPLLTPEASRSETSSNNELVTGEEKPVLRRKSTRATRASLRGLDKLREADEDNEADDSEASMDLKSRTVSGETLVNSIAEPRVSRSSLRHSIAVMEKSWSQTTLLRDTAEHDDVARLDTPVSKESQESPGPSTRRRSLRVRPEKELIESRTPEKEQNTVDRPEKPSPARRSSRLSLVSKAAGMVDRATSVLGKRSRDAMEKTKEVLNRKASLRPRHSMPLKEDPAAGDSSQLPASKKRRVSESDLQPKKEELEKEDAQQAAPVAPRYKPKRWLMEGMYTGQDRNMDPRLNEANNKIKAAKRNVPVEAQRKYLPMPMFGGERLLRIGRDFKLPYDIFSPMPPGQPKPDEWRKVNKSECPKCS
jgi:histone-lysine N-methyltransferase ASH1L